MGLFIFILIFAAFLQTAFLQINLCLTILICRSFVIEEKQNYYLAFVAGISLGFLSTQNIGFWALTFLLVVKLTHMVRSFPFRASSLTIVPVTFVLILITTYFENLIFSLTSVFLNVIFAAFVSFPIYILIKFWEERFTVKPQVKLKI